MQRVLPAAAWFLRELGSLVVFYAAKPYLGLRWAIVLSTLYALGEIGRRLLRKEPFTGLFKFSTAMTVLFGAVDIWTGNPTMFKYEAAVSNLMSAVFFGASIVGRKSIIQEFYENRPGAKPMTPGLVTYFRGFTLVWAAYFVAKAALYAWIAHRYGMDTGLIVRVVLGNVSFYGLLAVSILGGPGIYRLLVRWGVLKHEAASPGVVPAG